MSKSTTPAGDHVIDLPTGDDTPETITAALVPVAPASETDENGFPLSYADPIPTTPENPVSATATPVPAAPESNGKAKKSKAPKAPKAKKPAAAPKDKAPRKPSSNVARSRSVAKEPAGSELTIPTEEITLHREMQSRASMFDEEAVETYKSLYQDDADALPPVKVIDIGAEEAEKRGTSRYICWDGFQRTKARLEAKLRQSRAVVAVGTWDQARLLSLSANATHGLPRSSADIRKVFTRILNDEELLDTILKGKGGAMRCLAAATGTSNGTVGNVLKALGKRCNGDKLVNYTPRSSESSTERHVRDGDPSGGLRVESKEAIKSRATAAVIKECVFAAEQIQRRMESLVNRDDAKTLVHELTRKAGLPITRDENVTGDSKTAKVAVTQYWPAIDKMLKCFEELETQFKNMNTNTSA